MKIKYTLNYSQRFALACEALVVESCLNYKRRRVLCASGLACIAMFFFQRYHGFALISMRLGDRYLFSELFWHILGGIVLGALIYWFLYVLPLRSAFREIRKFIERESKGLDTHYELKIEDDGITIAQKHGSRTVFFKEVERFVCGETGCFVYSTNKKIELCIHKTAIDFATLQSLLPKHVKYHTKPQGIF